MTFEEYVSSRGPALVRLARLLTGDEHRAEDLAQDVLARAYVHWRKIARADRPDVYVRRMLANANNSWWRRRSNRELAVADFGERPQHGDLGGTRVAVDPADPRTWD
ncbi:Sigma-70 region 2 [Micromonospora echinofusca]|uniref:Sigma-70 region 2 n=1 Tax=Micromonospora echinofusca TaxID=47858 RepID=A0A1C5G3P2_MICEH|nr:sigma factor [Micromonospora echinofusca]SCG14499.1 Sigma-70 region 2 [Micromonospora echinofusca]